MTNPLTKGGEGIYCEKQRIFLEVCVLEDYYASG